MLNASSFIVVTGLLVSFNKQKISSRYFSFSVNGTSIRANDIIYAYAGLRPLVADAGDAPGQTYGMSRGAEIF